MTKIGGTMKNFYKLITSKKALMFSIIALSLPAITEMFFHTMLGVADTIMISQMISKEALSAVGFANQIVFTLIFIFSSFNTGAIALISRAYGEKDYVKLEKVAEQNIVINIIIGSIIAVLALLGKNYIFSIYNVTDEVYKNTIIYFNIILIGFIPMFLGFAYSAIMRGSGDTKTPMKISIFANVLNIIGNYVLITGLGPFPEMGIAGAALSTSISRIISLSIYVYIFYFKESKNKLKFKLFIDPSILKPLWKISLPGAVEQGLMQTSFVVLGIFVSQLDTASEAAFRILIQIESISFMPAVGISIATATLVGKSLGEKNIENASETGYMSTFLGVVWGVIMGLVFILIPKPLLYAFSTEDVVLVVGMAAMPFLGINQPALNFMIVMSGALRGAGDTKAVMKITSMRLWLIFIPFSYVFIIKMGSGVVGLWYAEIMSFVLFSYVVYRRFKSKKWAKLEVN